HTHRGPVVEGREQDAIENSRSRGLALARGAEHPGPWFGVKRRRRNFHRACWRRRWRRDAIGDPYGIVRMGKLRRIANRGPYYPAGYVAKATHGIPHGSHLSCDTQPYPAVPQEIFKLDRPQ